jgi:hypothetical protein
MSTDESFAGYLAALIRLLEEGEPASMQRLRAFVGARVASLELDGEIVEARFEQRGSQALCLEPRAAHRPGVARGRSESAAVIALMRGDLELSQALLDGLIEAQGNVADVSIMAIAVDILLDASTRIPAMVELARRFHARRSPPGTRHVSATSAASVERRQLALLDRLGLTDEPAGREQPT